MLTPQADGAPARLAIPTLPALKSLKMGTADGLASMFKERHLPVKGESVNRNKPSSRLNQALNPMYTPSPNSVENSFSHPIDLSSRSSNAEHHRGFPAA